MRRLIRAYADWLWQGFEIEPFEISMEDVMRDLSHGRVLDHTQRVDLAPADPPVDLPPRSNEVAAA